MKMSEQKKDKTLQFVIFFYFELMKSKEISSAQKMKIQEKAEKESGVSFEYILEQAINNTPVKLEKDPFSSFILIALGDESLNKSAVLTTIAKVEVEIGMQIEDLQIMQ